MQVRGRLGVNGDAVGARARDIAHLALGTLDHHVDVDQAAGVVDQVRDRADDDRAERDRRHEVPVHHVDMDHPRTGVEHVLDLSAEPREVGRQDRRRDARFAQHPAAS